VPRDIGIVGFGDTPFAPFLTPSLSSVKGSVDDIAKLVVGGLFSLLNGGTPKALRSVPRELVIRESSARGRLGTGAGRLTGTSTRSSRRRIAASAP
jgi:LacI family transcriptional regulator, asc operon repressor